MSRDPVRAANRATFAEAVAHPEQDIDLARAALLIAAAGRPYLDPQAALDELDRIAARVGSPGLAGGSPDQGSPDGLTALHRALYDDLGFRSPNDRRCDADHSLLDIVLARRIGLPISLAIVEIDVARRVGLDLHGIGLPGHFIVGTATGLLFDPADGGRRLTPDDCQALMRQALRKPALLRPSMLNPAGSRSILARMLRNLRVARLVARDWPGALAAIELLEVLEPEDAGHPRDRGLLLGRMGRFSDGVALLGAYVELTPEAYDAEHVRRAMAMFADRRN